MAIMVVHAPIKCVLRIGCVAFFLLGLAVCPSLVLLLLVSKHDLKDFVISFFFGFSEILLTHFVLAKDRLDLSMGLDNIREVIRRQLGSLSCSTTLGTLFIKCHICNNGEFL